MKRLLCACLALLAIYNGYSQTGGKASGQVLKADQPAGGATITLLLAKDSSTIQQSVSSEKGQYTFSGLANGKYVVAVTSVGYQRVFSPIFAISPQVPGVQLAALHLTALDQNLESVTVSGKKALIEQRIDRTVINVDASITNVGTSALEVLEKSPGVSVDRDGGISLKGKEGVLIMIDGRPTQLGGADLANLLRNMSSNQLDQIEIMTNPPARYDAAGSSGIINIKTKKVTKAGLNGSANIAYSQGKYPKTNEGLNFNYRNGKINVFTNLSHNYQQRFGRMNLDRRIVNPDNNSLEKIFNQETRRTGTGNSYSAKLGIDFFATKKTTIGAVVNLNTRDMTMVSPNVTNISNSSKVFESVTKATVNNTNQWTGLNTNLNFRHLLNNKGRELTSDIDFLNYRTDNNLFMVNAYYDAVGNAYRDADTLVGILPQNIDVYSARIDYIHPLKKGAKLEAGFKSSVVRTDNDAKYDSIQSGRPVHDINRSNHFIYEENINAAYLNFSAPLTKKINAQLGLRVENTNAKGTQITTSEQFDRHYTQLFPTAFFQYKANAKNNFGANFGRRVSRPSYQSLNPFIQFLDRYTFSQGNPNLRPSISNNVELSHTWKNMITTTLNYTHTKDIVQGIILQRGDEAYNMPANVSSLNQFGIAVNANTTFTKWWTSNININVYNDRYKGVIENDAIDLAATSYVLNASQQFKITKTFSAEINGRYRSGWLEGVMKLRPIGFVGAGISKQVWKNKGMIRLTARDIFYTQKQKGYTRYGDVDVEMRQVAETQIVTLGFSYNFSKGKKIAPVKRTIGSANEEQGRIGGN